MNEIKQICVIGMGLLGSSVTLSVKREMPSVRVIGYSHRSDTRQKARQYGVAHEIVDDLNEGVAGADLVILATPIQTFADYFLKISPFLKKGCIVTDVGSTKTMPHTWAAKLLPKGVFYVGSHPIAGSEKRGVEFARDDLLTGARCIVTCVKKTDSVCAKLVERFWLRLGCKVHIMSPAQHDRLFGMVSHLPHITAMSLVNTCDPEDMKFAGRGFIDTTRVSSGPANVWADILLTNPKNCSAGISKLIRQLEIMKEAIAKNDYQKIEKLLTRAAQKRADMIQHKIDQNELF
jgi:prephenate dehydrogenase